jgi:hypothetical protein
MQVVPLAAVAQKLMSGCIGKLGDAFSNSFTSQGDVP